ncbi:S-layer homology domain-containing protein [Cohnella suwonensis]|uniref:S-layer homology domain-containing protein n=1 Tax=Cohnella suwonensis TaxID=696072 RepID=A0ABW0LZW3_9BACL
MSRPSLHTKWLSGILAAVVLLLAFHAPVSKAAELQQAQVNEADSTVSNPAPGTISMQRYSDVPDHAWYAEAVNDWIARGILAPNEGDTFQPRFVTTRGDFAYLLAYSLGLAPSATSGVFTDVSGNELAGYFAALKEAGLANGYQDGTFRPNQPVTRAEAASWIAAALKLTLKPQTGSPFRDVPTTSWYSGAVGELTSMGILSGKTKDRFAPGDVIARAETFNLLYRSFYKSYLIQDIKEDGTIIIDGHAYRAGDSVKGIFQRSNLTALRNAAIQFTRHGDTIVSVENLHIGYKDALAGQHESLVFNAQGNTINGVLIVNADQLSLANVEVKGDLLLTSAIKTNFFGYDVLVLGQAVYLEDTGTPKSQIANLEFQQSDLGKLVLANSANVKQVNLVPDTLSKSSRNPKNEVHISANLGALFCMNDCSVVKTPGLQSTPKGPSSNKALIAKAAADAAAKAAADAAAKAAADAAAKAAANAAAKAAADAAAKAAADAAAAKAAADAAAKAAADAAAKAAADPAAKAAADAAAKAAADAAAKAAADAAAKAAADAAAKAAADAAAKAAADAAAKAAADAAAKAAADGAAKAAAEAAIKAPGTANSPSLLPGLYVQVIDGLINLSNPGGSQNFSAGQFGFTPSFTLPPITVPKSPGFPFALPAPFNTPTPPGSKPKANKDIDVTKLNCGNVRCNVETFTESQVDTSSTGSIGTAIVHSGANLQYLGIGPIDKLIIGDSDSTTDATFTGSANINHVTVKGKDGAKTVLNLQGTIGTLESTGSPLVKLADSLKISNLIVPTGVNPNSLFVNGNDLFRVAAINGQLTAPVTAPPVIVTPPSDTTPPNGMSAQTTVVQKIDSTTEGTVTINDEDAAAQGVHHYRVFAAIGRNATTSDPYQQVSVTGAVYLDLDALTSGTIAPSDGQDVYFTVVAYDTAGNASVPTDYDMASVTWNMFGHPNGVNTLTVEQSGSTQASLTFTDLDRVAQGVAYYKVYVAIGSGIASNFQEVSRASEGNVITIELHSLGLPDIANGDVVHFTVVAVKSGGVDSIPTHTDKATVIWQTLASEG